MGNENLNLSTYFIKYAKENPKKVAFISPHRYDSNGIYEEKITHYGEMLQMVANYRQGLIDEGFRKGDRMALICHANLDIYALAMACMSMGVAILFMKPDYSLKQTKKILATKRFKGIVSTPELLRRWPLIPNLWFKKRYSVTSKLFKVKKVTKFFALGATKQFAAKYLSPNDSVLFTFKKNEKDALICQEQNAQYAYDQFKMLEKSLMLKESDVDMPRSLIFGFKNLLKGVTTVIPASNYTKSINPSVIAYQMKKWKVTRTSGPEELAMGLLS